MLPVYVIHLPDPERKKRIAAELDKAGFTDITYVHAKEPFSGFTMNNMRRNPRGEFGCALSHVKAMMLALDNERDNEYLFIEDDIEFLRPVPYLSECLIGDVLYLGGHPRGPIEPDPIVSWLYRIRGGYSCAEAYVMHRDAILDFLPYWCDRAGQKNAMFDFVLGDFATAGHGYAIRPAVVHQPPGWSHIGQKHDDKSHLYEKGWRENIVA